MTPPPFDPSVKGIVRDFVVGRVMVPTVGAPGLSSGVMDKTLLFIESPILLVVMHLILYSIPPTRFDMSTKLSPGDTVAGPIRMFSF